MAFQKPDRLPRGLGPERLLRLQFGDWVARPWMDRAAFRGLGWYFPLSRLWAAASVADGDPARFAEEVPLPPGKSPDSWLAEKALAGVREAHRRYRRISSEWEETFFSGAERSPSQLVESELERRAAARVWMASRGLLVPLLASNEVSPVRWELPRESWIRDRYGPAVADPAAFYQPPDTLPAIEASHRVPGPEGYEYWLRFPSPGRAEPDTTWAKVYESEDRRADAPTLIYCHGLAVETEMWGTTTGVPPLLLRAGIRIVVLESPWHNRRMAPGRWGGEPMIATAPRGALALFEAALGEIATLIDWARGQGGGKVALGGTSLGALTSQLAAVQAVSWPERLRPDLLYLVATGGSVQQVAVDSDLDEVFGLREALTDAGWSDETLTWLRPLTDPLGEPAMKPESIVMVLGRADRVTRFDEGRRLAENWRIPEENLFIRDQGHFSVPLGLMHDDAPLRRMRDLLR